MDVNNFTRAFIGVQRAFPGRRHFPHTNGIFPPDKHPEQKKDYVQIRSVLQSEFMRVLIYKKKSPKKGTLTITLN